MSSPVFPIYAVSDATGDLAQNLAVSAASQFENIGFQIIRRGRVVTDKRLQSVVREAKQAHGIILFTIVNQDLRRKLLSLSKEEDVIAMDVMGPVLDMLSQYFHTLPSSEPGLQYRQTQDYFKRTEAIEFAVSHDEGMGLDSLHQADIILLGISRTSKTPLSIFLAYQGYRCANIPIVMGMPLPEKINELDPKKLVGLLVQPDRLVAFRSTRLKKMGRAADEDYAQEEQVQKELDYAQSLFAKIPGITVVNVTGKAIEELAAEIIQSLMS